MTHKGRAFIAALLTLLLPLYAQANDTSVGGTGVDLRSLKESSVRMKAEDIVITYKDGDWQVLGTYTFENPTDKAVSLQVGFPEVGCPKEEDGECHAQAFSGLATEVDGKPVVHRRGSLAKTEEWAEYLGTFWLFDVTFPPHKEVRIVHRYTMDATIDSMGTSYMTYVTRTGSTWAGPISQAKFRVRVPPYALRVMAMEPLGKESEPTLVQEGDAAFTQVIFDRKDWTPTGDLTVGFATAFSHYPVPRLDPGALAQRAQALGIDAEDLCPAQSSHHFEEPKSAAQAQNCRNLIYAMWGYPFKKKQLSDLYYAGGQGWHAPEGEGGSTRVRDPAPLPGFRMAWTAKAEQVRLKEIKFEGEPEPTPPAAAEARKGEPKSAQAQPKPPRPASKKPSPKAPSPQASRLGCALKSLRPAAPPVSVLVSLALLCASVRRRRRITD